MRGINRMNKHRSHGEMHGGENIEHMEEKNMEGKGEERGTCTHGGEGDTQGREEHGEYMEGKNITEGEFQRCI